MLNGAKVAEGGKEMTGCLVDSKKIYQAHKERKQTWRSRDRSRACAVMTERRRDVGMVFGTSGASGAGETSIGFFDTVACVSEITLLHR